MKSIVKLDSPLVSPPSDFKGDFFKGMTCVRLLYWSLYLLLLFIDGHLCLRVMKVYLFSRNSERIDRRGAHKCGGQIWRALTGQRWFFFFFFRIVVTLQFRSLSNVCSHGSHTCSLLLLQTTTTLGSSWTVFWVWRSTSRTPCSSTSLTRWEPSSRRPRRTADTTWAFLVSRSLFFFFSIHKYRSQSGTEDLSFNLKGVNC